MRYPAVAGRFYPSDKGDLESLIRQCFLHEPGPGSIPDADSGNRTGAVLAPHAGIGVSGPVAAHSFAELRKGGHRDAYVVIGPDHYGQPYDLVMSSEPYSTPMGKVPVNGCIAKRLAEFIPDSPSSHRREHSIEVELPFLQFIDPDAEIVPIIMGDQDIGTAEKLAEAIRRATDGMDVAIIASSDLVHYVPDRVEKDMDDAFLDRVAALDIDGMYGEVYGRGLTVCGYGPIAAALMAVRPRSARLLYHSNSWDTTGYDRDAVVGYASMAFE